MSPASFDARQEQKCNGVKGSPPASGLQGEAALQDDGIYDLNAGFMEKGDQTTNITLTDGQGEPENNRYVYAFCFLCDGTDLGLTFHIQQSMKNNSRSDD